MANSMAVPLPPELLLAAKRGDWKKLHESMSNGGAVLAPSPPQVTVDIDIEKVDDDDIDIKKFDDDIDIEKVVDDVQHGLADSVLHVIASSWLLSGGEHEPLMTSFFDKVQNLLDARNARGDTPLHCAARAGNTRMVSILIDLARRRRGDSDGGGGEALQLLRKENRQGETVLHDAICMGDEEMVRVLMAADAELARFPRNGVSPLYRAILLGHDGIAEQLYQKDNELSYAGPDGQNAMHAAVVRSERMTEKLLKWNHELIKQGDRSRGSTPLHSAASWGTRTSGRRVAKLLLDAYELSTMTSGRRAAELLLDASESLAYQADNKGSFPIHVAVLRDNREVVGVLLKKCPDCAQLQDAEGRTILHIAALKGYHHLVWWIVSFLRGKNACAVKSFASNMNMRDNQGYTALHYAATSRSYKTVHPFIWYREVQLNLQNNKGETALDLARMTRPPGIYLYWYDPEVRIITLLGAAGARSGVYPRGEDEFQEPDEAKEAQKIKDSTATIGIAAVLIITISFAAAFQFPGGYTQGGDDKQPAGTPELAKAYSFEAFVVANNLAVFCSAVATLSVMYAGVTTVGLVIRQRAFLISIFFLSSSARSLAAAFSFGSYAMQAPVAPAAAVLTWVLTSLLVLDIAWFTWMKIEDEWVLRNRRRGATVCLRVVLVSVGTTLLLLWPYVVIAGFLAYLKLVHGGSIH